MLPQMKEKRQEDESEEVESPFPSQQLFVLGMRVLFFFLVGHADILPS
jgi:hypothetical protein